MVITLIFSPDTRDNSVLDEMFIYKVRQVMGKPSFCDQMVAFTNSDLLKIFITIVQFLKLWNQSLPSNSIHVLRKNELQIK